MSKKNWLGAVLLALFVLAGCSASKRHAAESSLSSNPAVQADRTKAVAIVNPCLPANVRLSPKGTVTLVQAASIAQQFKTKTARTAFAKCVVPDNPARRAALEQCINSAALADHVLTKAGRLQFAEGTNSSKPNLVACVVRYAGKGQ